MTEQLRVESCWTGMRVSWKALRFFERSAASGVVSLGWEDCEFLAFEIEFLFFEIELSAPVFFVGGVGANGLDGGEGAAEGAFGLGFIAVEEVELVEVFGGPGGDVGFLFVEMEFEGGGDAEAAVEIPAGFGGIVDEGGVLGVGGLVEGVEFVEEALEVGGVFVGEEESVRGTAVAESVESGVEMSHGMCSFWLKDGMEENEVEENMAVSC